jgi:cupin 2 domain-containing protein
MAEAQLQRFLQKVQQLNQLVAMIEEDPALRARLSACSNHSEVVKLAAGLGLEIGQRWGDPQLSARAASRNLLAGPGPECGREETTVLLQGQGLRLERIHSCGAVTPPGQWYDQAQGEWVAVLQGSAQLLFADQAEPTPLHCGDWLWIEPRRRHRVEATDSERGCIWLVLFIEPSLEPLLVG